MGGRGSGGRTAGVGASAWHHQTERRRARGDRGAFYLAVEAGVVEVYNKARSSVASKELLNTFKKSRKGEIWGDTLCDELDDILAIVGHGLAETAKPREMTEPITGVLHPGPLPAKRPKGPLRGIWERVAAEELTWRGISITPRMVRTCHYAQLKKMDLNSQTRQRSVFDFLS